MQFATTGNKVKEQEHGTTKVCEVGHRFTTHDSNVRLTPGWFMVHDSNVKLADGSRFPLCTNG